MTMKNTLTNTELTIVNGDVTIDQFNLNNKIETIFGLLDNELKHNEELQNKVATEVVKDLVVKRETLSYKKSKINFDKELSQFLKQQNSQKIASVYKDGIVGYTTHLKNTNKTFFNITVSDVDEYITILMSKYSPRTTRLVIRSLSTFYRFLMFRHPDVFTVNVFYKRKLPKDIDTLPKDFLTDTDLKIIKQEFRRLERDDILTMINLITKYGWRIGLFQHLRINKNNNTWTSVSKGEQKQGTLTKTEVKNIIDSNLLNTTVSTLQTTFKKYCKKLYSKNIISCCPSVHDLRRYCIQKEVTLNGGLEFLKTSQKYHDSPLTTLSYIRTTIRNR